MEHVKTFALLPDLVAGSYADVRENTLRPAKFGLYSRNCLLSFDNSPCRTTKLFHHWVGKQRRDVLRHRRQNIFALLCLERNSSLNAVTPPLSRPRSTRHCDLETPTTEHAFECQLIPKLLAMGTTLFPRERLQRMRGGSFPRKLLDLCYKWIAWLSLTARSYGRLTGSAP